jgi:hypothetical protein
VTYIYNLSDQAWVGRVLGFYGPYANLTISPDANVFKSPRGWKSALCAGAKNAWTHTTEEGFTKERTHHSQLQVVWFDNLDSTSRGVSIGRNVDVDTATTAGEIIGRRRLEFQSFYGEPKERTKTKRFLYEDIIVTDKTSNFDVEFDVDEVTNVREVNFDVTAAGAGYTVYRAYLGVVGWKLTVRVDFNDNNDGQMAFLGGSVGYQVATEKGFTAVPPRGRVA